MPEWDTLVAGPEQQTALAGVDVAQVFAASYRKLVVSDGLAAGATILGHHPRELAAAQKAVRDRIPVDRQMIEALRRGDWDVLSDAQAPVSPR